MCSARSPRPSQGAYPCLGGGTTGAVRGRSFGKLVSTSRRGVRVGRRSATGNRVGVVKASRGFESHPLRFLLLFAGETQNSQDGKEEVPALRRDLFTTTVLHPLAQSRVHRAGEFVVHAG